MIFYALECFEMNGHSSLFLSEYFDMISQFWPYTIEDRTIHGLMALVDEICNEGNVSQTLSHQKLSHHGKISVQKSPQICT